jgi:hypothetical protein
LSPTVAFGNLSFGVVFDRSGAIAIETGDSFGSMCSSLPVGAEELAGVAEDEGALDAVEAVVDAVSVGGGLFG